MGDYHHYLPRFSISLRAMNARAVDDDGWTKYFDVASHSHNAHASAIAARRNMRDARTITGMHCLGNAYFRSIEMSCQELQRLLLPYSAARHDAQKLFSPPQSYIKCSSRSKNFHFYFFIAINTIKSKIAAISLTASQLAQRSLLSQNFVLSLESPLHDEYRIF